MFFLGAFFRSPSGVVVVQASSGVLLERFFNHPLVHLRRDAMDKRRLAEFLQIIRQLVKPQSVQAAPQISFGEPFTLEEILQESEDRRVMPAVIARMKAHLKAHLDWIQGSIQV